jgi:uncharacterized protein (DUF362 family)
MTGVSLGIKNLWGCYPDAMRVLHHDNLDYKLALLAKLLNPRITIIDGTYGLTEHGPMFGQPLQMNLILVSNNVVVADALGTSIMGIPIKTANHIKVAEKEGLGTTCLEKVNMNTDWKQYKKQFCVRKTLVDRANRVLFNSYTAAKLVYDSPFTPLVYYLVDRLRSAEETDVAVELKTTKY